jgi:S-adenosylmethionine decarboxylase
MVLGSLQELCDALDMHMLSKPLIMEAPDNDFKDPGGLSCFVIIAESHIAIHTFPKRRFVSADVYTCKNGMDTDLILNFFKKKFQLEEIESNFITRGKKYPEYNLV